MPESIKTLRDLTLLAHFVAVYRHGSFRSAADELGVTQSSVTKRIQLLESQLGLRLFNRTTRAVEPTDTARQLIAAAENALRGANAFQAEARLLAGGDLGSIRVGAIALAAETLIVDSLARLSRSHPDLEVEVVVGSSDVYRDVATGECDVVIGDEANFAGSGYAPALRMQPLHEERLMFVHRAGHPAARTRQLSRLLRYPLTIPSRYFTDNRLFASFAEQTKRADIPKYRLNSLSACLSLVAISDVVTLAPQTVARRLIQAGSPQAVAISSCDAGINIRLVFVTVARHSPSPAVRAFQSALIDKP